MNDKDKLTIILLSKSTRRMLKEWKPRGISYDKAILYMLLLLKHKNKIEDERKEMKKKMMEL